MGNEGENMNADKENIIENENEFYLGKIFAMLKKMEKIAIANKSATLGDTELRLISEIVFSNYKGERLISTQLAKKLDVTRSAVSQIVKKLEKDGIIKRVPDETDKKIAYIELTENSLDGYEKAKEEGEVFVGKLIENFGKNKLDTLLALSEEFWGIIEKLNTI